ncbi:class I SAM-dependent methyltransferase [Mycobacterium sp. ML5]
MGFNRVYQRLITQAGLADGQRVLEIGGGTGNVIIRAKQFRPAIDAAGCDPDPLALDRARRKAVVMTGIRFDRGYAQRLPYGDCQFDRVLSSMLLHHVGADAKADVVAEVFRVLRPGGHLHLVDIAGDAHTHHGLLTRLVRRNPHFSENIGARFQSYCMKPVLTARSSSRHRSAWWDESPTTRPLGRPRRRPHWIDFHAECWVVVGGVVGGVVGLVVGGVVGLVVGGVVGLVVGGVVGLVVTGGFVVGFVVCGDVASRTHRGGFCSQ